MIVMERLPKRRRARGSRLIEALIVITVMLGIAVILAPKETGDRMNANEMAVIRELQTINTMQVEYKSKFQRFATTLAELGPHGADLIPSTLASGDKDGYVFIMTATPKGYTIHANPKVFGRSGYRTFFTGQDGLIRQNWSAEPANASSPEFK
jgi:hypothetical protein